MVSDHGFGPCLGRIHVNRILVDAGVARLPGWAGRLGRRTMQMGDRLRLWGQKRDNPTARSASFDQSVAAQYRFDWKRTLAFAPHQDTAAMVYVNCAARHGGVKTAAPRIPRGRSTTPGRPRRRRLQPSPSTPRQEPPLSSDHSHRRDTISSTPNAKDIPTSSRLAR
jgi:hypothetical protein